MRYTEATTTICPGDVLVMYSDGVTEATDPAGEEFGEDRLLKVDRRSGKEAQGIVDAVHGAVREFTAGRAPRTDITVVAAVRT